MVLGRGRESENVVWPGEGRWEISSQPGSSVCVAETGKAPFNGILGSLGLEKPSEITEHQHDVSQVPHTNHFWTLPGVGTPPLPCASLSTLPEKEFSQIPGVLQHCKPKYRGFLFLYTYFTNILLYKYFIPLHKFSPPGFLPAPGVVFFSFSLPSLPQVTPRAGA